MSFVMSWFHAWSGVWEPVSTRVMAVEIAFFTSPSCGPRICGWSFDAESPKILPIGAGVGLFGSADPPLKYLSVAEATVGSLAAFEFDGKLPTALNTAASCSAAVSQLIRSYASFWCFDAFGMARYEPPQSPPLPGMLAMFHWPLIAPASDLM